MQGTGRQRRDVPGEPPVLVEGGTAQRGGVAVLIDMLAEQCPLSYEKRQAILDIENLHQRVKYVLELLHSEAEVYQIRRELQEQLKG